jgi:micrococcal nuclease
MRWIVRVVVLAVIVGGGQPVLSQIMRDALRTTESVAGVSFGDAATDLAAGVGRSRVTVVRVVDGDTVVVREHGKEVTIRLLGVSAPEDTVKKECFGKQATAHAKSLLPAGKTVHLERDSARPKPDKWGRTLGYLVAGKTIVNLDLIFGGYAKEFSFKGEPPYKYRAMFVTAERSAAAQQRGLWKACGGDAHKPL